VVYFFKSFISHMGVCFTIFSIAVGGGIMWVFVLLYLALRLGGGGVLIINMAPPFKDKKEFALIIFLIGPTLTLSLLVDSSLIYYI